MWPTDIAVVVVVRWAMSTQGGIELQLQQVVRMNELLSGSYCGDIKMRFDWVQKDRTRGDYAIIRNAHATLLLIVLFLQWWLIRINMQDEYLYTNILLTFKFGVLEIATI